MLNSEVVIYQNPTATTVLKAFVSVDFSRNYVPKWREGGLRTMRDIQRLQGELCDCNN